MNHIAILEGKYLKNIQENVILFLEKEKFYAENSFDWLKLKICPGYIAGEGILNTNLSQYKISLSYSPFYPGRFDRIYIHDSSIKYNDSIHLYSDMALCLYHPIFDKPFLRHIPLYSMIPWISEWCFFYEQWKKYGVWLGREIKHNVTFVK